MPIYLVNQIEQLGSTRKAQVCAAALVRLVRDFGLAGCDLEIKIDGFVAGLWGWADVHSIQDLSLQLPQA